MKFLYHDMDIDLQLKQKANWMNSVLTFGANTYLNDANPMVEGMPPRVVKYTAERDMTKGFINMLLKSLFAGLKESIVMSKENREAHQEKKNKWFKKNK
jgi:hypothetical protein